MKAVIIGSGNVATWFAFALKKAKIKVTQIYSPTLEHGKILADSCGCEAIDSMSELRTDANIYIFSIKDDAYEKTISEISFRMPLAVLTAGSVSQRVLAEKSERYGVVYPCQTISRLADFSKLVVPLCIEGDDKTTEDQLCEFARFVSDKVYKINEEQREKLHLAAVFSSNFTNAMYGVGFDILRASNIDSELIIPLLQNTLDKISLMNPWQAQTGPARRHDEKIIQKQLNELKENKLREIYRLISEWIENKTDGK